MDNTAHSVAPTGNDAHLQKPKSRLLMFRDRLLSPHLKEYRPHAAESLHQLQVPSAHVHQSVSQLECGPMPNVMAALPNVGSALCSTPQTLADAHYSSGV